MKLSFTKKELFNIPNILCYIRVLCVPLFALVFFLMQGIEGIDPYAYMYTALAVFVFASLTDIVDGKIARRFHMESAIGAALDPLADKLLQVMAVICLTVNGNVYVAFAVLIGFGEVLQMIAAALLANKNIVGKANYWGKAGAFVTAIGVILSCFGGAPDFMAVGAYQQTLFAVSPDGGALGYMTNIPLVGHIIYWFSFGFLAIGTALSWTAKSIYAKIVVEQLGGVKKIKDAENVRLNFFDNSSEACATREEVQAAEAAEEAAKAESEPEDK
ncbi:MAG: CDP-alcohol phosphatidyltransferase family protein [Clostridia bacterium]|nr:CDP-alcohol phosphatidyltransferase family protein [Clostridia bacterium]